MASLSPFWNVEFSQAPGGRLHTYASGTTTPKQTYQDQAGAVPHALPTAGVALSGITLDALGRPAGGFFIGTGEYTFHLYSAAGTLIETWDNIASVDAEVRADAANAATIAKGVGMIGFDPTVAYTSTLGQWLKRDLSVFQYIPVAQWAAILAGTSTYDASGAIINALNAAFARAPCRLDFPSGRYKCDAVLGVIAATAGNVDIDLNGSILDFSAMSLGSSTTLLDLSGTYNGSAVALSSNAASGQKTVACVSTTFAVGDMVRVYSESIWDSTRTSSKYGELNWIETVPDGSSVTLVNYLANTYTTAATAKIEKLTPVENVSIHDGTIQGPSGNDLLAAIKVRLGVNVRVERMNFFDLDIVQLQLIDCAHCKVIGNHFEETISSATGYGISFADATQDCSAIGNTFVNVRHSLSTNNSPATSWGITRRILFANNTVTDSAPTTGGTGGDAIDTHAGSEDITIENNTVNSSSGTGINAEGRWVKMRGNQVSNCAGNGLTYQNYTDLTGGCDISGNTVRNVFGSYCIAVVTQGAAIKSAVVADNNTSATAVGLKITGSATYSFLNLSVTGNTVSNSSGNTGIDIEDADVVSVTGNSVYTQAIGIQLEDCNDGAVSGNSVELAASSGSTGYGIRVQGTSNAILVSGNALLNSGSLSAAAAVSFINTTTTYSGIYSNVGRAMTAGTVFNVGTGTGNAAANNITAP